MVSKLHHHMQIDDTLIIFRTKRVSLCLLTCVFKSPELIQHSIPSHMQSSKRWLLVSIRAPGSTPVNSKLSYLSSLYLRSSRHMNVSFRKLLKRLLLINVSKISSLSFKMITICQRTTKKLPSSQTKKKFFSLSMKWNNYISRFSKGQAPTLLQKEIKMLEKS